MNANGKTRVYLERLAKSFETISNYVQSHLTEGERNEV